LPLIEGSIAELALAQRSPGPGSILVVGVVWVPRCCRVLHEPVPRSRAQTSVCGHSCAVNLQTREHQRLWLGLALLKIFFPPLRPGWMSTVWGAKRRASVWEASPGAVLHLAHSPCLGLLELALPAPKSSRS